ncbi:MAG: hypothetical protein J3R72DRAFT_220966 [Linnemannia gamsii]|nr:MAG: hypothetical protein J3R72DRAFT_220966 [Linnemannia gamsii]
MPIRHPRDTATWRARVNSLGHFQKALTVLLILCLCITSAKALRECIDGKPEEGFNACPCIKHHIPYITKDNKIVLSMDQPPMDQPPLSERLRSHFLNRHPFNQKYFLDRYPFLKEFYSAKPPYFTTLSPVGSEGLTISERRELKSRCYSVPLCCVNLEDPNTDMVCSTETDCRTIEESNRVRECISLRTCLQWSDSRCDTPKDRFNRDGVRVVGTGTHCICRKYSKRCKVVV